MDGSRGSPTGDPAIATHTGMNTSAPEPALTPAMRVAFLDGRGTVVQVSESWRMLAREVGTAPHLDVFVGANYLDECTRAGQRGCHAANEVRLGIESVLAGRATSFRHEYEEEAGGVQCEIVAERLDGETIIVAHVDPSARRPSDREVERYDRHVAHLGRLALVGQLAGTIAHELRQPLSAIRANAEAGALLVREESVGSRELREVFDAVLLDDLRAARIIERVRRLLHGESSTDVPVQLNDVCRAVHVLDHQASMQHTSIRLILDPLLPETMGDPEALQQVVINLALNALESVSEVRGARDILVATRQHDSELEITVRDTGVGLSPEVQQHLFEPFRSTKPLGTGLGLSIVRSIVERHGGRVSAHSCPSGGAEFRVVLPIRTESSPDP